MNKLSLVIGPAPSEMPIEMLKEKLIKVIERTNSTLSITSVNKRKAKGGKRKSARKKKDSLSDLTLLTLAEKTGIPLEQLLKEMKK